MPVSVGSIVRNLAQDGYFGKKDLQTAATGMLDGRGITHREKRSFQNAFEEVLADRDVYVTDTAKRAFDHLKRRTSHFSEGKKIYGATVDKEEIKDILSEYTEGRVVYSGGESAMAVRMGGRAAERGSPAHDIGSAPPSPVNRSYSGGEFSW